MEGVSPDLLSALSSQVRANPGTVNIVDIEPMKTRIGGAWERKKGSIAEFILKYLKVKAGFSALVAQLDETRFIVSQPEITAAVAQSFCVRVTHEILEAFLGSSSSDLVRVLVADNVGEITAATPLPQDRVDQLIKSAKAEQSRGRVSHSYPVLTRLGIPMSLRASVEPLCAAKDGGRKIGYATHRSVVSLESGAGSSEVKERLRIHPADMAEIDLTTLEHVLAWSRAENVELRSAIVPVSYLTLTNSSARHRLFHGIRLLDREVRRSFGWEMVDLDPGVPTSQLAELVALARTHCRGVICELPITVASAEKARAAGACLSTSPAAGLKYSEYNLLRLEAEMKRISKIVPFILFQQVPPELAPLVSFIGGTHLTESRAA